MKVQITFELDSSWDDYKDVCDELLAEDMDVVQKYGVSIVDIKRLEE